MTKRDYSYLTDPVLDALIAGEKRLATEDDWWQEDSRDRHNDVTTCLMMALEELSLGSDHSFQAVAEAQNLTMKVGGFVNVCETFDWNDAPERTFAEVKTLQRRAIEARLRRHNIVMVIPAQAKAEQP